MKSRLFLPFLIVFLCLGVRAATSDPQPTLEFEISKTNLVVTEEMTLTLRLWMPPLEEGFAETPPVLSQRPPHLSVPFWHPDWKRAAIESVEPRRVPPINSQNASRSAPCFTLNDFVTDGFASLRAGMNSRNPFAGLFDDDDDFFGRSLGPRKATFPFETRRVKRGKVNGWEFVVSSLPYRAKEPGKVVFDSVVAKVPVITSVRTQRDRFGRAVHSPTLKEVTLRTRPWTVTVIEPPFAGRPASYCGAISSNLVVKASLDVNICTAGDPLVLTLDVSGATDLTAVTAPAFVDVLKKDGVFRLDEGSLKTETLADSRRFTWRVRPLKAGTVDFPSLPVSYYDINRQAYVTRKTESFPVQVKAGVQAALGDMNDAVDESEVFPLPDGLDFDPRGAETEPLLPHLPLALVLFLVTPLLFTVIRLAPPVRRRLAAQRLATRRASAYRVCCRALKGRDVEKRARAICTFFETRYGVKGTTVTAADAQRLMADDYTADEIKVLVDALSDADRTNYSARKVVVSLLICCLATFSVFGASPAFTLRRAGALATQATEEKGFKAAAAAYTDCLKEGAANPILYGNLGACALMGGEPRLALQAYACAERRCGATATTTRGIRAALARIKNDPRADLPLTRTLCAPHVLIPLDARLLFAAIVWTFGWLCLLLPCGALRRILLTFCIVAFLASALSVTVSLTSEHLAKGVIYATR